MTEDSRALLNPHQQRRLRVTCQYIDKTLADVEGILSSAATKSTFQKYIADLQPAERRVVEDYIGRIRAHLVRVLKGQGIQPEPPSIPVTRAVHASLTFLDIAAEELKPKYMRGYGEVSEAAAAELNGIAGELQGLVQTLDRFVSQNKGHDLAQRLEQLEKAGKDVSTLSVLEHVISERGLVEFRPSLNMLLDRMEDNSFEIAIFGRVSSGKSSLLDKILETDVLPVGVTPITAVPTRIMHGEQPSVSVWFAEKAAQQLPIEHLAEFVAEQYNPANAKHVTRIIVQLPAPRLREGIVFVDTPGLGSLATSGAAETLAYLPRCDLGVVLIDAASSLTPNDLETIRTLYEAGIPAQLLLSKTDLLKEQDRARMIGYIQDHINSELGLDLKVRSISVIAGYEGLLENWFVRDIEPLYAARQQMRSVSLERKIGGLKRSVEVALAAKLRRGPSVESEAAVDQAEERLRQATARIVEAESAVVREADGIAAGTRLVLHNAAVALLEAWSTDPQVDVTKLLRDQIGAFAQAKGWMLREHLVSLGRELASSLKEAAALIRVVDGPDEDEFLSLVREMPILDPGPLRVGIKPPSVAAILGRGVAQSRVEHKLAGEAEYAISQLLADYRRVLASWAKRVLAELRQRYESYADAYRAQAARMMGIGAGTSQQEQQAIRDDLEQLRRLEVDSTEAVTDALSTGERIHIA
jgi:GTP-binding protein EngB required for normal cell division